MLESMLTRTRPDYMESADIKWNFTKFLIDRNGNVVERFEPTADIGILLQPHRFYGDCGKSLHASAVAAGSDRSRHGIRRTPAGFGIGAGVAAGEGKMRRM